MKKQKRRSKPLPFSADQAVALHKQGKSVSEIAQSFGYAMGDGNNRVRRVLREAGLYKPGKRGRKATTPVKQAAAVPPMAETIPASSLNADIPNDAETALLICLRTIDVNVAKLKMDAAGQGKFARSLMGAIATNFGVTDFRVRRPVLVLDQQKALHVVQVANA